MELQNTAAGQTVQSGLSIYVHPIVLEIRPDGAERENMPLVPSRDLIHTFGPFIIKQTSP